jgi:hypothetical protein
MTVPPSPRDQLEAAIWRILGTLGAFPEQVDAILDAADTYASAEVGLLTPAERRAVLSAALEGHPHD